MYIETIFKTWCPFCQIINFINAGCTDDLTNPTINGVICHSCEKRYLLDEDSLRYEWIEENETWEEFIENRNFRQGKKAKDL